MFIVIKKRMLALAAGILVVVLLCAGATAGALAFSPDTDVVVVLDAGHGGIDDGCIGVNSKVSEAEINLILAKKIASFLKEQGVTVVLTRENEKGLYTETGRFKSQDMAARKKIILDSAPKLVVSIHCNKFPDSSRRGAQVFYEPLSEQGKALADSLQNNLNTLNAEYVQRSFTALKGDYYILNCSKYPSAIVECGFLSNPEDDALLNNEDYRNKLAYRIFCGILGYLATEE
jgi:N-acetylmuramoyl-L-alanine amidase